MAVKTWIDGDYVQASDLNEFVSSGNLTFANAAARDAFLVGSLAPVAGMTATLLDDGITYRRITVGAASYWAPPPGTFICSYQQTTTHNLSFSSTTVITNMTTVYARSSPWWAANKFTPLVPGFYQLDGQVAWAVDGVDAGRGSAFTRNGATIEGSMAVYFPASSSAAVIYPTRTCAAYFNGTTDYAQLVAYNPSVNSNVTVVSATAVSAVSIKYLGP